MIKIYSNEQNNIALNLISITIDLQSSLIKAIDNTFILKKYELQTLN